MNQQLTTAIKYWDYVAPVVKYPKNDAELLELMGELDELLMLVGGDENHRLMGLVDAISSFIAAYEAEHASTIMSTGIDALKFLMEMHRLNQADLPEVASQGVLSEILQGKRKLNLRQIKVLAQRFHVSPATFIE